MYISIYVLTLMIFSLQFVGRPPMRKNKIHLQKWIFIHVIGLSAYNVYVGLNFI